MNLKDNLSLETEIGSFLKNQFGLEPKNMDLFLSAFTHASFRSEYDLGNYEKLEFLGDSCVNLIITDALYDLDLSLKDMCNLRKEIIQNTSLSYVSKKMQLDKYLRLGKSCGKPTDAILEDIYESFIGAIYLNFGFEIAKEVVLKTLWSRFLNHELRDSLDYKTRLQEISQGIFKKTAEYVLDKVEKGPDGTNLFCVSVFVNGELRGQGKGKKLKEAEQKAAKHAIHNWS